ncbi:interferon-induced very large GTPase 1-like isoform X1 [Myripristis murdjan]|uniref:interferon-induced very large GTPase 1-like isoform X1 n=1 Tax=Myripristis murdjan TaxID=586833 RepID=UPI001175E8CA|nr:interferon-induced very large GTPase 1-like isoform X1 [Myripristis murdjan]
MDSSDEDDIYNESDSFVVLPCGGGEDTSTPQPERGVQEIPPPRQIAALHVGSDTVSLGWPPIDVSVPCKFHLTITCNTETKTVFIAHCSSTAVVGLHPGTEYNFSLTRVAANGNQSKATSISLFTEPAPPEKIMVDDVNTDSVSLSWDTPAGEVGGYTVACHHEEETVQELTTHTNSLTISSLQPGEKYSFHVSTQLKNGRVSEPAVTSACTKTQLEGLLEDLRLEQHYTQKLSLSTVLQIDEKTFADESAKCPSDLPWCFLKKLMMVNVTARNVKFMSAREPNCDENIHLDLDDLLNSSSSSDMLNPLDIITALFLCSDGFVQQEMALKMSMCQFSVPLLLPNSDKNQCTLMLWAMRDIVKKYRPQSLSQTKGFIEERIVLSELPMVSFVRLGECSLSKSEILNKLLSNSQQYHDTFVHRNMECGDSPRRISNGLAEISWYLPCGNKNIDIFGEPVAVANLRGDVASFETQYSFLCQTSAAVFVFFDSLDAQYKLLSNYHSKAQIFLVGNAQSKSFSIDALKNVATELNLTNSNIILKTKQINDADFVKNLRKTVRDVVESSKTKIRVEQMAGIAHELGILVDEDSPECQSAKQNADAITAEIQDILKYKEAQLPLQGQIWKELTRIEKEECRLKNAGAENIEKYKSDLLQEKRKLRGQQNRYNMSNAMACFIQAISSPGKERCYFLKWMRINLDNLSREKLSGLREQYKEKCQNPENKKEIKDLDRRLSNSSLGTEHFLREMGQIYEAAVSLPETEASHQQLKHLPKLCAELLLDGFPLELVDGDASNIPLRWVSDVLSELKTLVCPKSKILVVTVLGVQSTGKSTLLNTMFGVQFAVSSGRCTRGAFMLLIRIQEDFKQQLNCDFLVIIDTEGLKSPELAQLDDSHEHDNELATLVVGLSNITIINIAMENSAEMRDILQIVVHAFLRMKEVGKKPKCQFVHQNVSDVSAHENNMRDRKLLLEQLDEMTQAAARMERKEENKSFTDVMEYKPDTGNWYIPGLWNGNPPMAPVNAGYSEAVYELKKNIIQILRDCESSDNDILEFIEWTKSLWNAVKHENFIFSFRNSLVADAYMQLCTEFNKWEWEFKKHMHNWVTEAETTISNFVVKSPKSLSELKSEACSEVTKWETALLQNVTQYFKQTEGHVHLVEAYREDFSNSAKSLRREIERSVINQLETAAEIRQGMTELERIKETHTSKLEQEVHALIEECRKEKSQMTEKELDKELDKEFDKVWSKTVRESSFAGLKTTDIIAIVHQQLRTNVSTKGSHASELVTQTRLCDCGIQPFKYTKLFKYTAGGLYNKVKHEVCKRLYIEDHVMAVQRMADNIIAACRQSVTEKVQKKTNYHDNYIQEILHLIDESLTKNQELKTDIEFEVSLKQHICGIAAREFQKMHEDFIQVNDPFRRLSQHKEKYCADFKDLFHKRDQCQKKAQEFTNLCLMPAVETYVNNYLGQDIVDEMLTSKRSLQFSTRTFFQYSVLMDLLSKDKFENYLSYICSYEDYVKNWIFDQIVECFSKGSVKTELEDRRLKEGISHINNAITKAHMEKNSDLKKFVEDICKEFDDKLVISQDALGAFMTLNTANQEQFAHWLKVGVEEMEKTLREKLKKINIQMKLKQLRIKPQNELFTRVFGCGKQCPFCKVACDAGGKDHSEHWATVHRSQGLGRFRFDRSEKLVTEICSSLTTSERQFRCHATNGEWHPYKNYKNFFPDWKIPPDGSLETSDYWKYVMTKFNKQFAKEYHAKPADIPEAWKAITRQQAEKSLKESFGIKEEPQHVRKIRLPLF